MCHGLAHTSLIPCSSLEHKLQVSYSTMGPIIFREHAASSWGQRAMSLFPGLGYAAGYKIAQRVYKFGGQPWFNDILNSRYKKQFADIFGEKQAKTMMHAAAGR